MSAPVLALDIGGTKLAAALVTADGAILDTHTVPTPRSGTGDPGLVYSGIAELLLWAVGRGGTPRGVGIGSAGPLDPLTGTVSPVNIPAWRDFDLVGRVRDRLPGVPVALAGDGICFTIGEHWRGATADHLLGLVVSTGVGGGLVLGGRLLAGRSGNAGHIGHAVVDLDGPPCTCGGRGCVEAIASGPNLVRWARGNGWRAGQRRLTARDLAADATAGDRVARAAFARCGTAVGAAITGVAATCELDRTVIGGGLAGAGDLLLGPVRAALRRYAQLSFLSRVDVRLSTLDHAGLLGAAALILHPDRYHTGQPAG